MAKKAPLLPEAIRQHPTLRKVLANKLAIIQLAFLGSDYSQPADHIFMGFNEDDAAETALAVYENCKADGLNEETNFPGEGALIFVLVKIDNGKLNIEKLDPYGFSKDSVSQGWLDRINADPAGTLTYLPKARKKAAPKATVTDLQPVKVALKRRAKGNAPIKAADVPLDAPKAKRRAKKPLEIGTLPPPLQARQKVKALKERIAAASVAAD